MNYSHSQPEVERLLEVYATRDANCHSTVYSLFEPAALLEYQGRVRNGIELLRGEGITDLANLDILDVGCGRGQWLIDLESAGATRRRLCGIDLVPSRIQHARKRLCSETEAADLRVGSGSNLPWNNDSFDLAIQSTVFSSILDGDMRSVVAQEIARVLRPGGFVLWYDLAWSNPKNPDVRGIRQVELRALFRGFEARTRRVTLAPPLARPIARRSLTIARILESLKVLNSHRIALLRKAQTRKP
jgi:ubiquinone/menaquinone biosynthesis C-methylase UbiE